MIMAKLPTPFSAPQFRASDAFCAIIASTDQYDKARNRGSTAAGTRKAGSNTAPPQRLRRHTSRHAVPCSGRPPHKRRRERRADDVDKGRGWSVGVGEIALQHADLGDREKRGGSSCDGLQI